MYWHWNVGFFVSTFHDVRKKKGNYGKKELGSQRNIKTAAFTERNCS